jgi:hypothetical protein
MSGWWNRPVTYFTDSIIKVRHNDDVPMSNKEVRMGFFDDAKKKAEDAKDDLMEKKDELDDKFHEKKGEMQGRADQERQDSANREIADDPYEREEEPS